MPDCDDITLLKEWTKNDQPSMSVVMMSSHAGIDTVVEATKVGTLDSLEEPTALQKFLSVIERALKHEEIQTASGMTLDKLDNNPII